MENKQMEEKVREQVVDDFYKAHRSKFVIDGKKKEERWRKFCGKLTEWWSCTKSKKRKRMSVDPLQEVWVKMS